ncbi:MAG: DUF2202 domain-containing protein [Pirellulaceae bacterium]|nr:DUF2202 domain-containing protein [Pirellulaceae bacterium]
MCRFKWFTVEAKRPALAANGMIIVFAFLSALTPQFAWAQGNGRGNGRGNGNSFQQYGKGSQASENQGSRQSGARGYNSIGGTLTPAQVGQLVRMREEEKLAHDVYVTLAQSSGLQIFNNIANAESQHMRAVEQLASRYSSVAAVNLPVGSFSDPQFQALYNSLVVAGSKSPIAAATVGAKIEEMDIKDLQTLLSQNPPQDVSKVLEHLQRASGQHLRAFTMELKRLGGTYMPEFLSPQEYNSILNSDNERGQGMGQGSEKGMHRGGGQANSNDHQMAPPSQKGNGKRGAGRK